MIDLRKCKAGNILISSQGAKLEYVSPTPYEGLTYLDHVVRYIEYIDGKPFKGNNLGTRTHDGYVFKHNRIPETDHNIIEIIHK